MSRLALLLAVNMLMLQLPAQAHVLDNSGGANSAVGCAKKVTSAKKTNCLDGFELSDFEAGDYQKTEIKQIEAKKVAPKAVAADKTAALKAASSTKVVVTTKPPAAPASANSSVTVVHTMPPAAPAIGATKPPTVTSSVATATKPPAVTSSVATATKPPAVTSSVTAATKPPAVTSSVTAATKPPNVRPASTEPPMIAVKAPAVAPPPVAKQQETKPEKVETKPAITESKPADTDKPAAQPQIATRAPFGPIQQFGPFREPFGPPQLHGPWLQDFQAVEKPEDRTEWLPLDQAREYMLSLINRDRQTAGLNPVELDKVASIAGQSHSNDMATSKYVSHWDLDGKKPDQRFTEAGGQGAVAENIALNRGFVDGQSYKIDTDQRFKKSELEKIEGLFFNELPPTDGHRRNILDAAHNKVGIGLTLAQPGNRITCSQEFVNQYGSFSKMPTHNLLSEKLGVEGKLENGLTIYAVDIYREDAPQAKSREDIKLPVPYTHPTENVAHYFPAPYTSPAPIKVQKTDGVETFSLDVKPQDSWKPGLYYVVVWAKKPDSTTPILCCTHTVDLQAPNIVSAPGEP